MKRFHLVRNKDISGVSGTGRVAEGVQFTDGTAALKWLVAPKSTGFYNSISDVIQVHDHRGTGNENGTHIEWID